MSGVRHTKLMASSVWDVSNREETGETSYERGWQVVRISWAILCTEDLSSSMHWAFTLPPPTSNDDTSEYSTPDPWFPLNLRSIDGALTFGGADPSLV